MRRFNGHSRAARHLVIFARYPTAGGGKKRLASAVGAIEALRFQRARLRVLLARLLHDPRWTTWLAVTPDRSGPWPPHVCVIAQGGGDLGARLAHVVWALPRGPVVIIGTDIPGIRAAHVASAFDALAGADAVLGPAPDGGYWLIGLKRAPRVRLPFTPVRWSSEHALTDTVRNLGDARIAHLGVLEDVDDATALRRQRTWARVIAC